MEQSSIKFQIGDQEVQPNNTIGVLLSELFMWIDVNKTASYIPGKHETNLIEPSELKWKNATILEQTADNVHVEFQLKEKVANGTIRLRLMVPTSLQKYHDLPHLQATSKSIHAQLILDGFQELITNNTMRFGMQLTVVSKGTKNKLEPLENYDRFDDEDSPGMFTTLKYTFGTLNSDTSFFSFKPNAYTTSDRLIAQTVDSKQAEFVELKNETCFQQNNAFYGFYSNRLDLNAYQMYITFGSIGKSVDILDEIRQKLILSFIPTGQNFYAKTNHTEFSFAFGLNDLPDAKVSLFIQMVIIIGSGLSLLVLLIFPISIYLMARKMKNRRDSALLNNQDSIY